MHVLVALNIFIVSDEYASQGKGTLVLGVNTVEYSQRLVKAGIS